MKLQAINHDGPVLVRELGVTDGIVWTVQPENFASLIEMVNNYGGPSHWSISPVV